MKPLDLIIDNCDMFLFFSENNYKKLIKKLFRELPIPGKTYYWCGKPLIFSPKCIETQTVIRIN